MAPNYVLRSKNGSALYVRIVVPQSLRSVVGKREFRRSLKTCDLLLGRRLAFEFAYKVNITFRAMRQSMNDPAALYGFIVSLAEQTVRLDNPYTKRDVDEAIRMAKELGLSHASNAPAPAAEKPLAQIWELYEKERLGAEAWTLRTYRQNEHSTKIYEAFCAANSLSPYQKTTARRFKSEELDLRLKLGRTTKNRYIGDLTTFFRWARDNGEISTDNPFVGLKVKASNGKRVKDRDAYTYAEVQLVLDAAVDPSHDPKNWLPLIGLYTGARRREIAQLYVDDIKTEDGVHFFDFSTDSSDSQQHIKNPQSYRKTPIHKELITRGFLTYVEELRKKRVARLFPMFGGSKYDGYGEAAGSWFLKTFRTKIGLKRTFHELRNTVITAFVNAKVYPPHYLAIVGQEKGQSTALTVYTSDLSLRELREVLDNNIPINPGRK